MLAEQRLETFLNSLERWNRWTWVYFLCILKVNSFWAIVSYFTVTLCNSLVQKLKPKTRTTDNSVLSSRNYFPALWNLCNIFCIILPFLALHSWSFLVLCALCSVGTFSSPCGFSGKLGLRSGDNGRHPPVSSSPHQAMTISGFCISARTSLIISSCVWKK